jgi:hypothetical protein
MFQISDSAVSHQQMWERKYMISSYVRLRVVVVGYLLPIVPKSE